MAHIGATVLQRGSSEDVTVTVAESPSLFYCQPLDSSKALSSLLNELSQHCESSEKVLSQPTVGRFCSALFTEDNTWYRAKVLSVAPGGVRVLYVDYGNSEDVPADYLRELPEAFARLPIQTWRCRLANVAPADRQSWSRQACDTFNAVIDDELCMEVAGPPGVDGTTPVCLRSYTTKKDMATELKNKGLAVEKTGEVDFVVGEDLQVTVVAVETPQHFWFQRAEHNELEKLMEELGARYERMVEAEHVISEPSVGDICCAQYSEDNSWYRAVVVVKSASSVTVRFLDYGNTEEVVQVKALLPEFSSSRLPPQAYHAGLAGLSKDTCWKDDICYAFEEWVLDQESLAVKITSICDEFLTIQLVDGNQASAAAKIIGQSTLPRQCATLPLCEVVDDKWYDLMVSHVNNANSLFCQLCNNRHDLQKVMESITRFRGKRVERAERGQLCIAPSSVDGQFYRAQVVNVVSSSVCQVQFVDFGNIEEVEVSELHDIEQAVCHLPKQAIPCSLCFPPHKAQEKASQLKAITHGKQLVGQFRMVGDTRSVKLLDTTGPTDIDVVEQLNKPLQAAFKYPCIRSRSTHEMFLACCDSPSEFWLSLLKRSDELDVLMETLAGYDGKLRPLPRGSVAVGAACCARFSEDDCLYRGLIISPVIAKQVEVRFVDYGNKEKRGPCDVYEIPPELLEEPVFAVCCSLSGVIHPKAGWSPDACEKLEHLLTDQDLTVSVIDGECSANSSLDVIVSISGKNVSEHFGQGLASPLQYNGDAVEHVTLPLKTIAPGSKHKVHVAHVESPDCFYVQFSADQEALDSLMDKLREYDPPQATAPWKPGMYCCSAFSEDDVLYRAKVTSLSENSLHVSYVDYGNDEERSVDDLLPLNKSLAQLPECAVKCSLHDVPVNGQDWSDAACESFIDLTAEEELEVEFTALRHGLWTVKLHLPSGQSISQHLVSRGLAKSAARQQLAPSSKVAFVQASLANTASVHVAHAESPQCFFCQPPEQLSNLDNLMENLQTYCSSAAPMPELQVEDGMPCSALYAEDGRWYRAVIVGKRSNEMVTVRFVDYGNTDTVQRSSLRSLKEQFVRMPMLAVKCHLAQPQPAGSVWTEEMNRQFVDQVLEQDISVKVVEHSGQSTAVCFVGDSKVIIDSLVPLSGPTASSSALALAKLAWKSGTNVLVYVTHCVSPSEFWCQPVDQASLLNDLSMQLDTHYKPLSKSKSSLTPAVGQLCAAKFSEDKQWYRAVITACDRNAAEVRFIDYGNEEVQSVDGLHVLEDKFVSFCPALAVPCSLANVSSTAGEWPNDVCGLFEERVASDKLRATVVSGDSSTCCAVLLQDASGNVADSLSSAQCQSCSLPASAVTISPANVQGSVDVFVPVAVSPGMFYCQLLSTFSDLGELMEDMAAFYSQTPRGACATLTAGLFCAAQYSEDDGWYRALLENSPDGLQVRFVDYGNAEPAEAERICPLERRFATLPAQAIQCALEGVSAPNGTWGQEARKQFCGLVVENEFRMTVSREENGRYCVHLVSGGTDVASAMGGQFSTAAPAASVMPKPKTVTLAVEREAVATITYYESPTRFYCQLEEFTGELEMLMSELQHISVRPLSGIHQGVLCAAPFSEDDLWYRSEVTSVEGQEVTVRFVDYGNSEVVDAGSVCHLPEPFARLPVMAVTCCLANVLPPCGDDWSVDAFKALEACSEGAVTLRVSHVTSDCVYEVKVTDASGQDLAEQLVASGLARKTGSSISDAASPLDSFEVNAMTTQTLDVGSEHAMIITHVVTPSDFWCQRGEFAGDLENVMVKLAENIPEKALSQTQAVEGAVCAALYAADETWYRARIVSVLGANTVCVHFVDYGNHEEVPLSDLRELPQSLCGLPAQAVHCSLAGMPSLSAEEWDEASILIISDWVEVEVHAAVVSSNKQAAPPKYELRVTSTEGNLNDLVTAAHQPAGVEGSTSPPSSVLASFPVAVSPAPGSTVSLVVTFVETPSVIWCQWADSADQLNELMATISTYFTEADGEPMPASEKVCAALYVADNNWYRGEVLSSASGEAEIFFVDYGNKDTIEMSNVRKLPQELAASLPCQAVACHLCGVAEPAAGWSADLRQLVEDEVVAKGCEMLVHSVTAGGALVGILKTGDGRDVAELVNELSSAARAGPSEDPAHTAEDLAEVPLVAEEKHAQLSTVLDSLKVGDALTASLSFVDDSGLLWLQPSSSADELVELQAQLAVHYDSKERNIQQLSTDDIMLGSLCAARFSDDMNWYRAQIMNFSDNGVTVHFVDYGNVGCMETSELCVLDSTFRSLPKQAFAVTVPAAVRAAEMNALQPLQELIDEEVKVVVTAAGKDGIKANVTFSSLGKCVEELVDMQEESAQQGEETSHIEEEIAVEVQESAVASYEHVAWPVGATTEVYISHVVSPSCIFCQPADEAEQLTELMANLADCVPRCDVASNMKPWKACAAIFSDDGGWYRGLVHSIKDDGKLADVCFVDYGNHEDVPVEDLRHLPEELLSLHAQAVKCSLAHVRPKDADGLWEQELCQGLKTLLADQAATVTVLEERSGEDAAVPVRLVLEDGTDVTQAVGALSGAVVESAEGSSTLDPSPRLCSRLDFSSLDSGDRGLVVIADSPFKFWCQLVTNVSELNDLATNLNDYCESGDVVDFKEGHPEVGEACAALFTDGGWYRAVVTGVNDSTFDVLLVDYGNEVTVKAEQIVPLLYEFGLLAAQAVCCSLYSVMPHGSGAWTADALNLFTSNVFEKEVVITVHGYREEVYGCQHIAAAAVEVDGRLVDVGHSLVSAGVAELTRKDGVQANRQSPVSLEHSDIEHHTQEMCDAEDIPPAVLEFSQQLPTVGQTMSVTLAFASSPDELWFQPVASGDQLEELGQGLADFYGFLAKGEHALPASHCITGMPCIAQYSNDSSWYRAVILTTDGYKAMVRFVDYGNIAELPASNLKLLHADFADLPVQAFWFSLAGIGPADESGEWSEEATERVQQLIGSEVVRANVLLVHVDDNSNKSFEIWLSDDNGQDISWQLINEGLAVQIGELPPQDEPSVESVCSENEDERGSEPSEDVPSKQDEGEEGISASERTLSPKPDNGVSGGTDADNCQPASKAQLRTSPLPEEVKDDAPDVEVESGAEAALSKIVGTAAAVVNGPETSMVPAEVEVSSPCNNDPLISGESTLNEHSESAEAEDVETSPVPGSGLGSDVDCTPGKNLGPARAVNDSQVDPVPAEERIPSPGVEPVIDECTSSDIAQSIAAVSDSETSRLPAEVKVMSPDLDSESGGDIESTFSESTRLTVAEKESEARLLPTTVNASPDSELVGDVESTLRDRAESVAVVISAETSPVAVEPDFPYEQASASPDLKKNGPAGALEELEEEAAESSASSKASMIELLKQSEHEVTVSLPGNPEEFWCQLVSKADDLEAVMATLGTVCSSGTSYESPPRVNDLCAAQFSEDDNWYRARVLDLEGSACTVFFIDYGNSETVELDRVRPLPPGCDHLPAQALKCCIKGSKGHAWTDAEIEGFYHLVLGKELRLRVLEPSARGEGANIVHVEDRSQDPPLDITQHVLSLAA